jgi:ADP-dependent NAD(P)H-hydrate dehydratase / NAD(P)H-hydrate epimerase
MQFDRLIIKDLYQPSRDSHKGQNGRLLVIGGSELFHAGIFLSAPVASKIVDLVHFASPAGENNDLVRKKLKEGFWEGIVVDFNEVEGYIEEDDCVLIGPGMTREEGTRNGERGTREIVNDLLKKFPSKRWVVDGGALQEVDDNLLNGNMIITPHQGEWLRLLSKFSITNDQPASPAGGFSIKDQLTKFSREHQNLTILLKGERDFVCQGEQVVEIDGGNAGLTKGGTGDVLAGLVAALYCKNDAFLSAQVGSYINKKAGESLAERVGVYYNAGDLVAEVPKILRRAVLY